MTCTKKKKTTSKGKATKLIALNTLFVIFGLASAFTGTYAWFLSTQVASTTVGNFSVVAPSGLEYDLFYLDHFEVDEANKIGNWNSNISEFSGYATSYGTGGDEDVVFEQVEYDEHGDVVPNAYGKDPTDIQKLWPAHKLTYALVFKDSAPSKFTLKSWDEGVKPIRPAQAISQVISVTSIVRTGTEDLTKFYTVTFSDGSTADFKRTGEGAPTPLSENLAVEVDESSQWVINGESTGISIVGDGGEVDLTVLGIKKTVTGDPDYYEITYSDLSTSTFSYDKGTIVSIPSHTPVVEISSNNWVVDGINTEIPIDGDLNTVISAPSLALSITKTASSTVENVTTDTYLITYSDSSTSTFTYDQTNITVNSSPEHTVTMPSDTFVVDGVDTKIDIDGQDLATVNVNLSWAIDLYGKAYSVEKTNEGDAADIASIYKSDYIDETVEDVFLFSQANPASAKDKVTPIEILDSVPSNSPGYRTIVFFTIEFSNDRNTFYSLDEKNGYYNKFVNGNSKCYEGLTLTDLSFSLS